MSSCVSRVFLIVAARNDVCLDVQSGVVSGAHRGFWPLSMTRMLSPVDIRVPWFQMSGVGCCVGAWMDRLALSDTMWARLAPHLPGKPSDPGRSAADNRRFMEAVLWMARAGAPWRDLPNGFGPWNSVFRRFRRWAKGGV